MNGKVIVLLLITIALASIFAVYPSYASTTPTLSVDSNTQQFPTAHVGDMIQVNITVSNMQDLWAWSISNLTFNSAIINLTQITEGPFLMTAGQTTFLWTNNVPVTISQGRVPEIDDVVLSDSGASGTGVIATLTFNVLSTGASPIAFGSITMENTRNIDSGDVFYCQSINGEVYIGVPAPSSSPTASPSTSTTSTSSPTTTATTSTNASPTSKSSTSSPTNSDIATPEFPALQIIGLMLIAVTVSLMLIQRKTKNSKTPSFP